MHAHAQHRVTICLILSLFLPYTFLSHLYSCIHPEIIFVQLRRHPVTFNYSMYVSKQDQQQANRKMAIC